MVRRSVPKAPFRCMVSVFKQLTDSRHGAGSEVKVRLLFRSYPIDPRLLLSHCLEGLVRVPVRALFVVYVEDLPNLVEDCIYPSGALILALRRISSQ